MTRELTEGAVSLWSSLCGRHARRLFASAGGGVDLASALCSSLLTCEHHITCRTVSHRQLPEQAGCWQHAGQLPGYITALLPDWSIASAAGTATAFCLIGCEAWPLLLLQSAHFMTPHPATVFLADSILSQAQCIFDVEFEELLAVKISCGRGRSGSRQPLRKLNQPQSAALS